MPGNSAIATLNSNMMELNRKCMMYILFHMLNA